MHSSSFDSRGDLRSLGVLYIQKERIVFTPLDQMANLTPVVVRPAGAMSSGNPMIWLVDELGEE